MKYPFLVLLLLLYLVQTQPATAAIDIVVDYSYDTNNFFNAAGNADWAAARARLEDATVYFESVADVLLSISPGGGNTWTPTFIHPGTGSFTSGTTDMSVSANTIILYAGGRNMGSLGIGGPGGFSGASGTGTFLTSLYRGQHAWNVASGDRTDFGVWGGSISFSISVTWHYGATTVGLDGSENDFFTVALHEMAHLMGFGTCASFDNLASGSFFTGTNSVNEYGGNVPLAGDVSHWATGTTSDVDGVPQETLMDPEITMGTRKYLTSLDYAALQDTGWLIPEPATAGLVLFGLFGVIMKRRR